MNAIIMAGGEGSRLRPLTCDIPKPLVPLCGRPILEYTIELLEKYKIDKAILTLMYKGNKIVEHFQDHPYNINLEYCFENKPLGTAGCVKNAIKECDGDFIVISGDAMCDFDLKKAIAYHKEKNSIATLILKKVDDPRQYGLVDIGSDGHIKSFIEKPSYSHYTCDNANTGVYILSNRILEYIEDDKFYDFANDVFPKIIQKNIPMYGYVETGYWCDVGDLKSYIQCQKDMLLQKVNCDIKANYDFGVYYKGNFPEGEFNIDPPVYIGENVVIGENVQLNRGTVICDNVTIGEETKLNQTVVMENCYISDNVTCNNAILCNNAKLLRFSNMYEGSVLGKDSVIGEHAIIKSDIKVWQNKNIDSYSEINEDVKYDYSNNIICDEQGISGEINGVITPILCNKIGSSLASLKDKVIIGVSCDNCNASNALKQSIISGILSAGGNVYDYGQNIETQFDFCVQKSMVDFGVYIDSGINSKIRLVQKGSLPILRNLERKLELLINKNEYKKVSQSDFGNVTNMSNLNELYQIELIKYCNTPLVNQNIEIKSLNTQIKKIMENTLKTLGFNLGKEGISIYISKDGKNISINTHETGFIFYEKLITLACLDNFINGKDVSIPYDSPRIIDKLAYKYNQKAYRYYTSPYDDSDKISRNLSLSQPYLKDCLMMAIKLLKFISENNYSLKSAIDLIPHFAVSSRLVSLSINPNAIIKKLNEKGTKLGEGININHQDGEILIRPLKSGKGLLMLAESIKSETASEICDFFENIINTI